MKRFICMALFALSLPIFSSCDKRDAEKDVPKGSTAIYFENLDDDPCCEAVHAVLTDNTPGSSFAEVRVERNKSLFIGHVQNPNDKESNFTITLNRMGFTVDSKQFGAGGTSCDTDGERRITIDWNGDEWDCND